MSLVFVLSPVLTGSANAADPNLVGWWKFDGDANDSSGNEHHGTLMGSPSPGFVPGMFDQALDTTVATGVGPDYVEITGYKGVLGAHAFSITAWIKTPDDAGEIVGWGNPLPCERVEFRLDSNRLRCEHGAGDVQGNTVMNDDEWHHVALTVKEGAAIQPPDVKLYLDGLDDTITPDSDPDLFNITENFDVTIARRYFESTRWLDALIDEVRIYDRELSADEIRILAGAFEPFLDSPADEAVLAAAGTWLKWTPGGGVCRRCERARGVPQRYF